MQPRTLARTALLLAASALAACSQFASTPSITAPGDTRQTLFTDNWLFAPSDAPNADTPSFNDSSWRKLNLPHDYSIEQPFDPSLASGTGFLPGGIAWYRKHFTLPAADKGKTITLRFDGIYKNSSVYLNGHKLGDRPYGYISFEYNLTPYLNPTGDNVLAVRVDHHDYADSRWYPGSGIYRNVYLIATHTTHIDRYGTFITTPQVSAESADVNINITSRNDRALLKLVEQGEDVVVTTMIVDQRSQIVGRKSTPLNFLNDPSRGMRFSGSPKSVSENFKITKPTLWSVDNPALYMAITEIRDAHDGKLLDSYTTPFGIRTVKFDPNTGFSLNGINMKLKGVCLHEDAGGLGSVIPQQVWERRLRILKDAGVNAIRTSHNPPSPHFLDLCDKLGFVVMDEAFDEWSGGKKKWLDTWSGTKFSTDGYHSDFNKWADTDIKDMVLRDRNHPSIIMWSIGNEIDYVNDPFPANSTELAAIAPRLIADIKSLDTTRPVTAACAAIATNLWYKDLDIVGYNYQESRYIQDHAQNPTRIIFGSENGHSLSAWLSVADNPFISSQFLWTGIDYNGEAGLPGQPTAWPERSRPDGFLDLAAFPKPMFYFRKSLWTNQPMVKIDSNLPGDRNVVPPGLAVYTNCDDLVLFQNGKSFGHNHVPPSHIVPLNGPGSPFNADPAQGPIRVVGLKAGKTVAEDTYTLAGPASKIALNDFKTTFGPGDGPNIAQIELTLLDAKNHRARDAANDISVALSGPGRILAIESGDTNSHENYQAPHHKAFHGRLLLYVETHGPVTLTTTTQGLAPATTHIGD